MTKKPFKSKVSLAQKGNYISEWLGQRIYPVVQLDVRKFPKIGYEICPFLSAVLRSDTKCVKNDNSPRRLHNLKKLSNSGARLAGVVMADPPSGARAGGTLTPGVRWDGKTLSEAFIHLYPHFVNLAIPCRRGYHKKKAPRKRGFLLQLDPGSRPA